MLGLHRVGAGGAGYYLSDLATELPPGPAPARARWLGSAAAGLGLEGPLHGDQLRAVLEGRHPQSDHRLGSARTRVHAVDLTFSAPKSVSVVLALGGSAVAEQVVAAHEEAVRGALGYVESHALAARRGTGEGRTLIATTGALAASVTHGVNRNLDPHLHTHLVVANLAHGLDGRWSALDQRGLWAHRPAIAAVYDAALRAGLSQRLGVHWHPVTMTRAEVTGVSPLLLGEFSSRSADIRRELHAPGARSARLAWAVTREPKPAGRPFADLASEWSRRAHAVGAPPAELGAVLGLPARPDRQAVDEHRFAAAVSGNPDGAARRRDVVTAFGASLVGGVPAGAIGSLTDHWVPEPPCRQPGVAEVAHPLGTVVPPGHLLRALGPRPADEQAHGVWRQAALAIEGYRRAWGITRSADALGLDALPSGVACLPASRLVEHLRVAQQVEVARRRLGWSRPPEREVGRGR